VQTKQQILKINLKLNLLKNVLLYRLLKILKLFKLFFVVCYKLFLISEYTHWYI